MTSDDICLCGHERSLHQSDGRCYGSPTRGGVACACKSFRYQEHRKPTWSNGEREDRAMSPTKPPLPAQSAARWHRHRQIKKMRQALERTTKTIKLLEPEILRELDELHAENRRLIEKVDVYESALMQVTKVGYPGGTVAREVASEALAAGKLLRAPADEEVADADV